MRSVIFANCLAPDTARLNATYRIEHREVRFLGQLVLDLWDCGGQDGFMEAYLNTDSGIAADGRVDASRQRVFDNAQALVYVLDVESRDDPKDAAYFQRTVAALHRVSPQAQLYVLAHKMDLVPQERRTALFRSLVARLRQLAQPMAVTAAFATSIWDESLYAAWSAIVCAFLPHREALQTGLAQFGEVCEAVEVVLFERATFLVIASATAEDIAASASSPSTRRQRRASSSSSSLDSADTDEHPEREAVGMRSWWRRPAKRVDPLASQPPASAPTAMTPPLVNLNRFEKVSNIVKQFKLCCFKASTQFRSLEISHPDMVLVLDGLTDSTYLLVVARPDAAGAINPGSLRVNIHAARPHFTQLLRMH